MIKQLILILTPEQLTKLKPLFEATDQANANGFGLLLAQPWRDGELRVALLCGEIAGQVTGAIEVLKRAGVKT